mmetsp:Transcript_8269/g.14997  ORF Transcript_8269/g.14997 Transcript_8269/m.14997 type:complete len:341 (-) Transcript_8269:60-1082(-)
MQTCQRRCSRIRARTRKRSKMPSDDDEKEMNLSGPEGYKQDLHESEAKIIPEGERRKPHKKRLVEMQSSDDDDGREGSPETSCDNNTSRQDLSIEERRKEARRASNRASAARARKRHKLTVQVLESTILKLKQESQLIRGQLDAALAENQQLRNMMTEEQKNLLGCNRVLQGTLGENILSDQHALGQPNLACRIRGLLNRTCPSTPFDYPLAQRSFSLPLSSYDSHRYPSFPLNNLAGTRYNETSERRETARTAFNSNDPPQPRAELSQPPSNSLISQIRQENANQINQVNAHGYASSANEQVETFSAQAPVSAPDPEVWIQHIQNQVADLRRKAKKNQL